MIDTNDLQDKLEGVAVMKTYHPKMDFGLHESHKTYSERERGLQMSSFCCPE